MSDESDERAAVREGYNRIIAYYESQIALLKWCRDMPLPDVAVVDISRAPTIANALPHLPPQDQRGRGYGPNALPHPPKPTTPG